MSHCLVRILVQRHNWVKEQGETVTVNGFRNRAMLNEFLFTKIEDQDIGNIWFQQVCDVLRPVSEDRIISRRADVVWPPQSCDLTPFDYYLWGAVRDECYADKPESIDALKENIRDAIGKIQLHTIDNVLKIEPIVQAILWPAEAAN